MILKAIAALVVAIVVGILLAALLGPILVTLKVTIAVTVGDFLIAWGWVLGILAGLWYFVQGPAPSWPAGRSGP